VSEATAVRFPDGEKAAMAELAEHLRGLIAKGIDHIVLYDEDVPKVVLGSAQDIDEPLSAQHERIGRSLYYILQELEPDFANLRTGTLIRTVLRMPTGAVFYYLVEPGIHLYGASSAVERIEALDESIAGSVNGLREAVRFSALDFGSFVSRRSAPGRPVAAVGHDRPAPGRAQPASRSAGTGANPVLSRALRPEGLHYLAYYRGDGSGGRSAPEVVDIFERPDLRQFFRATTPEHRRGRYHRLGTLLPGVMRRMNESLRAVLRGELVRVVLDVEQGAVYFHTLPDAGFLLGVTLDQNFVAVSDDQMSRTAKELAETGGGDAAKKVATPSPFA
jgi:hypothetical protein